MDYSAEVRRRFNAPGWVGGSRSDLPGCVIAEACDRSLNVWVQCRVQISDGIIRGLGFSIFGCPHTVAAADWIGESLDGQPVERLTSVDIHAVARELEVPKAKLGKLLRIEDALMGCAKKVEGTQLVKGSD